MTFPPDPRKAQRLDRMRSRKIARVIGLLTMIFGYGLLAVYPDTPLEWVLLRVALGFACLLVGFGLAIAPLLGRFLGDDED